LEIKQWGDGQESPCSFQSTTEIWQVYSEIDCRRFDFQIRNRASSSTDIAKERNRCIGLIRLVGGLVVVVTGVLVVLVIPVVVEVSGEVVVVP
jgi:hypothetical protein